MQEMPFESQGVVPLAFYWTFGGLTKGRLTPTTACQEHVKLNPGSALLDILAGKSRRVLLKSSLLEHSQDNRLEAS
jgi:hypothetical protein